LREVKVIPCLDIKDGRVVKGVKFVNLRDARDPVEAAEAYCREGADELVFLDIFATVQNRKTRLEWVKRVADVVTVPFAVGGGIGSVDDMKELFKMGVHIHQYRRGQKTGAYQGGGAGVRQGEAGSSYRWKKESP